MGWQKSAAAMRYTAYLRIGSYWTSGSTRIRVVITASHVAVPNAEPPHKSPPNADAKETPGILGTDGDGDGGARSTRDLSHRPREDLTDLQKD